MKPIKKIIVTSKPPQGLEKLKEIAYNLWWTWNPEAINLFKQLNAEAWENCYHNPIKMLSVIPQDQLEIKAQDKNFLANLGNVWKTYKAYLDNHKTWYEKKYGRSEKPIVAYFSAEFGLSECVPIYSGGLGMLAGDHLKSASDIGIPLVAVGLLYKVGYFQQHIDADGTQREQYPINDSLNMPVIPIKDEQDENLTIKVQIADRFVYAQIWKINVGRVPLILLDTDTPLNSEADRTITSGLYGGDKETRIQQEILLGIGGLRALHILNYHPTVYHMNEGHSAFLALERIRLAMERHQMSFSEARELTRISNLFTTHTPVPAGIDVFDRAIMERYFAQYAPKIGISFDNLFDIGLQPNSNEFSMAVCALNLSAYANGVSKLHGEVSRGMWANLYPNIPTHEIPIGSVTNGVHIRSYVSQELAQLYSKYIPNWMDEPEKPWESKVPDTELWQIHQQKKNEMITFIRERLTKQLIAQKALASEISDADEALNPLHLTIGFARRFATYKRANLLFKDKERLASILCNPERPIQIVIAGKAHPKDEPGKSFIKEVYNHACDEKLKKHIVFIENYDVVIARALVQGVDVWLNNPRRPLEASGTSGMKASANGILNLSILDGWWDEGYQPETGWAIGHREILNNQEQQDELEANALYDLLENEIAQLFYEKHNEWVEWMQNAITKLTPYFNTNRMVAEYTEKYYMLAYNQYKLLSADDKKPAKELAAHLAKIKNSWNNIKIENVETSEEELETGEELTIKAKVSLGNLTPDDVIVQAYFGILENDQITSPQIIQLKSNNIEFVASTKIKINGQIGLTVRVLPNVTNPIIYKMICWG